MKLADPDIDPHVVDPGHQIGIARQPEPHDVEQDGDALIRHPHIDMAKLDHVADILGGPVEHRLGGLGVHRLSPQVPVHTGGRLARKASIPSAASWAIMLRVITADA